MLISRECDYAIRIVRQLTDKEKRTTEEICVRERIPTPFAYKILKKLEKSGFVRAFRGARGGYALIKDPAVFTLYDIFTAIGDQMELTACLKEGFECPMNPPEKRCGVHKEYIRLQELFFAGMREKTMQELLK
jgi:Rrf2 family protein